VAAVLERECGAPSFSAAAEVEPGLLGLEVAGLGPVRLPVTPAQARKLRDLGAPARYGHGTKTLTDASVRDTWEIPRQAVTVRWADGFAPLLDALREELGLPSSCGLRAEFHSMLVYERGQFFLPHQDSEKDELVYLLDHEYTERGLGWARLKGGDAARAALLRAAAERAGSRVMLALCEIQETWEAYSADEEDDWYGDRAGDEEDEDDEKAGHDAGDYGADRDYELNDLVDSSTRLVRWTDPDAGRTEKIALGVDETELCAGAANSALSPYEQQYEGYMGNYGNTLDRWYRRAALVLFPADREFANRAEASPHWAMTQIGKRARVGDLAGARADAADLAPFWAASIRESPQPDALVKALRTAYVLEDAATATLLLVPFRVGHLTGAAAAPLARLADQYGAEWACTLLRGWFGADSPRGFEFAFTFGRERLEWYAALPNLCQALQGAGADVGAAAQTLADLSWQRLRTEADGLSAVTAPSRRDAALAELGKPLASVLTAAENCGPGGLAERIMQRLVELGEGTTAWLLSAVREAAARSEQQRPGGAFETVAAACGRRLRNRLARPVRAAGDWSITASADCSCALCEVLSAFLKDPARRVHEWPLAKDNRRHIHSRIDRYELPVSHQTRRQGRPYTLVLAKQDTLFDAERAARTRDEADLAWLAATWPVAAEHR
jgi:hypothetical protein